MKHSVEHLDIRGYRFAYAEQGQGEAIVFVHGSFDDYRSWLPQLEAFSRSNRAIAYSRRYHWPNTPIANGDDYSMDQHVADLADFIQALGVGPAFIVGHSYGAFVGLLLAIRRPELVRALVLSEPPAVTLFVGNPPSASEILKLAITRPRTALTIARFGARVIEPAIKAFKAGEHDKGFANFTQHLLGKEKFQAMTDSRLAQARQNLIPAEFLGSLFPALDDDWIRGVNKPAMLVGGEKSPKVFHLLLDRLEELLPDTRRTLVPMASHLVHEDNPKAFEAALFGFLDRRTDDYSASVR